MFKKILAAVVFIFSLLFFVPGANASTLYLSPRSANIPQGSVVSVAVGLNTAGESVNGVSAYLSYPADKLEVAWISYGGSFSIAAEGSYGGGGIRISRGSISGVVGSVNVATVGFRGKAQGPATVAFIGGSAAPKTSDSSDSLNLGGSAGGTFTVTAPVPGGQAGAVTASSAAKDLKVPAISDIKVSLVSTASATISWTTDEKADSEVVYGLQTDRYFLSARDQNLTTTHLVKIEGSALTPGTLFHYRIKSKDAAGNEGISEDRMFQLKGYNITIKISDTDNKPITDTEVLFYGAPDKAQTSAIGEVSFANVTPGRHLVVVKIKNSSEKTSEIDVKDAPFSQNFTLTIDTQLNATDYLYLVLAIMGLAGIIVLVIIIIILLKKRQQPPIGVPQEPTQNTGV